MNVFDEIDITFLSELRDKLETLFVTEDAFDYYRIITSSIKITKRQFINIGQSISAEQAFRNFVSQPILVLLSRL